MTKSNKGIALLEVLVSVAILTFGMGAAIKAIQTCTRTQSDMNDRVLARSLAEQQFNALRLRGAEGITGDASGRFDAPFDAFSWTAERFESPGDMPLSMVQLKVWKTTRGARKKVYQTRIPLPQ
jgi:type II secretion system protein I